MGFPMLAHSLRLAPARVVAPLLTAERDRAFAEALSGVRGTEELQEFLQLWHSALRRASGSRRKGHPLGPDRGPQ